MLSAYCTLEITPSSSLRRSSRVALLKFSVILTPDEILSVRADISTAKSLITVSPNALDTSKTPGEAVELAA